MATAAKKKKRTRHPSAEKRARRNPRRAAINATRMSSIKTALKKVEQAIGGGDHKTAMEAFKAAQPDLQRGVTKGVVHKNAASRKLSRLNARIKALSAPKASA